MTISPPSQRRLSVAAAAVLGVAALTLSSPAVEGRAATVARVDVVATISVRCGTDHSDPPPTLVPHLPDASLSFAATAAGWLPTGNPAAAAGYQSSASVGTVCHDPGLPPATGWVAFAAGTHRTATAAPSPPAILGPVPVVTPVIEGAAPTAAPVGWPMIALILSLAAGLVASVGVRLRRQTDPRRDLQVVAELSAPPCDDEHGLAE